MTQNYLLALFATVAFSFLGSKDFYGRYENGVYRFALSLPKGVLLREFSSDEALILKNSDIRKPHAMVARLSVIPLAFSSDIRVNSNDSLARSTISHCVQHSLTGGPDGSSECEPTDSISFGRLTNGIKYVKFYLRRLDLDKYGSHSNIVGPFYGFDVSSGMRKFVLVFWDGGYLLPKANDQRLQWRVASSLAITK